MRRKVLTGIAAGIAAGLTTRTGFAQAPAFPNKTVRFIVGLGPGSGADTGTRFVAERFSKITGQPAVVENRTGADQVIAVQNLLQAPPDGHTLLYISPSPMVLTPLLNPATPYEPLRDMRPLVYMGRGQAVIVTGANSRFKTLQDVLTEAGPNPNPCACPTTGTTTASAGCRCRRPPAPCSTTSPTRAPRRPTTT